MFNIVLNMLNVLPAHKHELHELTMNRTLGGASGLFELVDFCLSGMLVNIPEILRQ